MRAFFKLVALLSLASTTSALAEWHPYQGATTGVAAASGSYVRTGSRHYHHRPYRGASVGVYVGAPLLWGWPWGPPVYYPPPVVYAPVVESPPPTVYVEKDDPDVRGAARSNEALEPGYWYYCREKGAYYPAVRNCPKAWEKVAPDGN